MSPRLARRITERGSAAHEVERRAFELTPAQEEFFEALRSERFSYLLFGGAIQSGKTSVALMSVITLCKLFPGSRWAVVRKDGPSLSRNTLPSFNRLRPEGFISAPTGKGVAYAANGSEVLFFSESLDRDPDYDRWKGLLVSGFVLEEANELDERTFVKALERAGTWKCPGARQPHPYLILTCNPTRNWVMHKFYLPWKQGTLAAPYYFQRALPGDNPHLTDAYRESLKNLPPDAYKRFVLGDWDVLDDPQQLISFEWLVHAREVARKPGERHLGVDVARFGDDYSCLAGREGNALVSLERLHGIDTQALGARVCARLQDTATAPGNVRVDVVGLGAGVADYCHAQQFQVAEFNASHTAPTQDRDGTESSLRFKNKRAWAWWQFREALRKGEVCIDVADTSRLFQDLASPRYRISGDRVVEIEGKDDLKKRLGRSPDEGDAVVMAWAQDPSEALAPLDLNGGLKPVDEDEDW